MSRRKYECREYIPYGYNRGYFEEGNCCCNFKMLVILILILLQFGKKSHYTEDGENNKDYQLIDNSILFIITLFYLSCCIQCR